MAKRNPYLAAALKLFKSGAKDLDEKISALVAEYVKAQARLEAKALEAAVSGKLGGMRYRRQRAAEARAILKALDQIALPRAKRLTADSYRLGSRVALRGMPEGRGSSLSTVDRQALDTLGENLVGRLGDASTTVGRRVDDLFRREGLRLAASQLADERSIQEAVQEMSERLAAQGVTAFTDRAGKNWGLDTYAEMAIQTVTTEAVSAGVEARMLARGLDLVTVNKVEGACAICIPYEDKTFSLTGRSSKYPRLDRKPPFHGRCRHGIFPSPLAFEDREAAAA